MLPLLLALALSTVVENQRTGSPDWELTDPAEAREIEGYASKTSVNGGEPIDLFVHTAAARYTIEVFRMGWYDGAGARRVAGPIERSGIAQEMPPPDQEWFTLISSRGISRPVAVHHQAVGWFLKGEHHHVSVSAHLGNGGGRASVEAYLMRSIGAGTNRGDEVAWTSMDLKYPFDGWVDLFTDLDLGPGEYWLIIAKPKETAFSSINWFVLQPRDWGGACDSILLGAKSYTFQTDTAEYLPASKFERKDQPYVFEFEVSELRPAGSTDCP